MASTLRVTLGLFLPFLCSQANAQVVLGSQFPLQAELASASNLTANCRQACTSLRGILGQAVLQPSLADLAEQYFARQQTEFLPQCVVQPETAEQVSQVITILKDQECAFAVKSGGHGMNRGASNIEDGVLIDLGRMNKLDVSEDEATVSIGTGARWGDVYLALQERGLVVVGGRVASVGVGGLILGGGISFYSNLYGMACDNVRNFELVLANGTIVNANQQTHPDLYYALRGGGNNFGVVTRFDLEAYRHGPLWSGTTVFNVEDLEEIKASAGVREKLQWNFPSIVAHGVNLLQRGASRLGLATKSRDIIRAFTNLAREERSDPQAHGYIFFSWVPDYKAYLAGTTMAYAKPEANPAAFREFTSLKKMYTTNRIANMSDFATEIEKMNLQNVRQIWDTATFKVDAEFISQLWQIFVSETEPIKDIPGTLSSCNQQLLTKDMIAHFSRNGGNAFGIAEEDGPLFLFSICASYINPEDDETMKQATKRTMNRAISLGQQMGLYHPYIYQNYAAADRDVFAGYGPENRDRLLRTQKKYDPDGVFSRLVPGHFKI